MLLYDINKTKPRLRKITLQTYAEWPQKERHWGQENQQETMWAEGD